MEWDSWSQTCSGQGTGSLCLWEGGGGQAGLPASASKCPGPWLEQRFPLMAPCTGENSYTTMGNGAGREWQHWHRHIPISFQQTQKTLTKEREASWLHIREVSLWQGQISTHKKYSASSIHSLQPSQISPNLGQKFSPDPTVLMPTGLKRQSCPISRATVPALISPAL